MCSRGRFAYCCVPFARVRRDLDDNLMSSEYESTDRARALHQMLARDRWLSREEKAQSLALLRVRLRRLLRYDLLERGRGQLLKDVREIGFPFGKWYFLGWWAVSLLPRPLWRLVRSLRRNKRA
jgi:hypothetical protein